MSAKLGGKFKPAVQEKMGNYVYRLIDPRNGETFYVGKGKGNRVFDHVNGALKLDGDEDDLSVKLARIREIQNSHLEVLHVVHRHEVPDTAIFEVEAALIDAFPGLSNDQGGHGSSSRGPMHVQQLMDKYGLPEMETLPPHKLVLINISMLTDRSDVQAILDQTRFAWRLSVERAKRADYVLAVVRGVVVGAFTAEVWLPATAANFSELEKGGVPSRWGFQGKPAPTDVWERYVGSRGKQIVNDDLKHVQNPIRYWQV